MDQSMDESLAATFDQERMLSRIDGLQDQVRRLEGDLERSHRLATLGLLAGSIAHEFNNVLTPVLSYAQMALATPEDMDLCRKALRKAADGTEKAAQIAAAMLGFLRDDPGAVSADVRAVVEDTLRCLGRDLFREGIALDISVPRGTEVAMRPVALEQVLMNLILNAVEALRPPRGGGGSLRITAEKVDKDIRISVEDTGCGMPAELVGRIFQPFVTVGGGEGRRTGTGLGLTICKRLVEEAGGTIGVESAEGVGTVFRVVAPGAGLT